MCEGEMLQIRLRDRIYTRQEYFEIIERKTGSLFSACAALGAILADRDEGDVALAGSFGADFGVAFQITDDLLDYTADHEKWGKDIGMDVSSGKQTLPVLLALESADEADRAELNAWIRNGRDPGPVLRIIERHQGMERALEEARRFAARAGEALASIEIADAAARDRLAALPDYVVGRAF
jgi:octaprenyl-diphosphate synthase